MDIQNYKCPSCGAPLVFDSNTQQMVCNSCDNTYSTEQLEDFELSKIKEDNIKEIQWSMPTESNYIPPEVKMKNFTCPSCGAEIVGDESTVATSCPYCDNPAVIPESVSGLLQPDYILPFQKDKNDAKKALKKFYEGKFLLPKSFKNENRIDKIQGIYVPFWLFDCDGSADMRFSATRVKTWSTSSYRYTKTDTYAIYRSGSMSFEGIPADGSTKLDDAYMDALEPFDRTQFVDFKTSYLSGYLADKYDVSAEQCMPRARVRIENSIRNQLSSTVVGYTTVMPTSCQMDMRGGKVKYALLPVWILNTKYNDKMYTFAMNGQTGKVVGELPCDKLRALGLWAAITGGLWLLSTITSLFMF